MLHESSPSEDLLKDFEINNCKVCFDIHEWKKKAQEHAFKDQPTSKAKFMGTAAATALPGTIVFTDDKKLDAVDLNVPEGYKACPPDALELGKSTWTFLHTMSVYYPDRPSTEQQSEMSQFLRLFSKFYPCGYCASHLREEMKKEPPVVDTRLGLARWLCRIHNEVNERLGKPLFDCEKVDERWRDGPSDGSC